ncbi:putative ABC transporter permease [Fusobacterium ulcerans]|uniref:putative ABC transporter permease n=1 Tax=Fusobacterium ulcerans TaxID=861 RepID=UPI002E78C750|nr:putative ABC transporter permease [Fusobacterium ulcerans]MEE0139796.1 putative ABC transporter permease [Fusobacterium ulcerans]
MASKEKIKYELRMYFFLFMLYSLIGWIYETILFSVEEGHFINRGFNFGPYIPIYGFGAVIIMIVISKFIVESDENNKFSMRPLKIFILILVLSTVAELIGSYIMEYSLGIILWDYRDEWMNFQGRISPKTSFIFAAGGTAAYYTIQPLGKKIIDKVSIKGQKMFASFLLILILIDFSASLVTTIWFSDSIKKAGIMERK